MSTPANNEEEEEREQLPSGKDDTAEDKEVDSELLDGVRDVFQKYNKKFNKKTTKNTDQMHQQCFRDLIDSIPSVKHRRQMPDLFQIFNEQSTDGSEVLNFKQFCCALKRLAALEVKWQSADQVISKHDMYEKILKDVIKLQPRKAGKDIGFVIAKDVTTVATTLPYIGPFATLLKVILSRIDAFKEVTDELNVFESLIGIVENSCKLMETRSQTPIMKSTLNQLVKILNKANVLFIKVSTDNSSKGRKYFTAKENKKSLKDLQTDLSDWIGLALQIAIDTNVENIRNCAEEQHQNLRNVEEELQNLQKVAAERHQEWRAANEIILNDFKERNPAEWKKFLEKHNIKFLSAELRVKFKITNKNFDDDLHDEFSEAHEKFENEIRSYLMRIHDVESREIFDIGFATGCVVVEYKLRVINRPSGRPAAVGDDGTMTAGESQVAKDVHDMLHDAAMEKRFGEFSILLSSIQVEDVTQSARTRSCMDVEILLPPELQNSNSDFLIYHAYEDRDNAMALREELLRKMPKMRLSTNGDDEEEVRIQILDDFNSSGVRQENVKIAVKSCSVKLLLVTERFVSLNSDGGHSLDIFKILEEECPGEVFALRYPDYNSYLRQLDVYVQGLMQEDFYDRNDEHFSDKMADIFKRRFKSRIDRDKELEQKQQRAMILEDPRESDKIPREEGRMKTLQQNINVDMVKVSEAETEEEKRINKPSLEIPAHDTVEDKNEDRELLASVNDDTADDKEEDRELLASGKDDTAEDKEADRKLLASVKDDTAEDRKLLASVKDDTAEDKEADRKLLASVKDDTAEDKEADRKLLASVKDDTAEDKEEDRELLASVNDDTAEDKEEDRELLASVEDDTAEDKEADRELLASVKDDTTEDKEEARELLASVKDDTAKDKEEDRELPDGVKDVTAEDKEEDRELLASVKDDTAEDKEADRELLASVKDDTTEDKEEARELLASVKDDTAKDKEEDRELPDGVKDVTAEDKEEDRELLNGVKDVFQRYNEYFNRTTKDNDSMETQSFRRLTEGITCLKHIKMQDKIKIFYEQSTEGSEVLNFEQFHRALKRLGVLEVKYRSQVAKSADQVPPEDDLYVEIFNNVKELNPKSFKDDTAEDKEKDRELLASGKDDTAEDKEEDRKLLASVNDDTAEDKEEDRELLASGKDDTAENKEKDRELPDGVKDVFQKYNKKFNKTTKDNDSMESRSFRHLTEGITCLKQIKRQDTIKVFDEQSTEGSQVLTFEQFHHALKSLGALEVEYRSRVAKSADPEKMHIEILYNVKELNPNSCEEFFRHGLNSYRKYEPMFIEAAGNALKDIGRATVRELATVGTTIAWIGPAVKLLKVIWKQIMAFEEIPEVLEDFGEMLLYSTDTVEFILTEEIYHTEMMQRRIVGLEKVLERAKELFGKVTKYKSLNLQKFFLAEGNEQFLTCLTELEEDLTCWTVLTYWVLLAENQEGINALNKRVLPLFMKVGKPQDVKEHNPAKWTKFMEKHNIRLTSSKISPFATRTGVKVKFEITNNNFDNDLHEKFSEAYEKFAKEIRPLLMRMHAVESFGIIDIGFAPGCVVEYKLRVMNHPSERLAAAGDDGTMTAGESQVTKDVCDMLHDDAMEVLSSSIQVEDTTPLYVEQQIGHLGGNIKGGESAPIMESSAMSSCYDLTADPRGLCVIVNNIKFTQSEGEEQSLKDRPGSEVDQEKLEVLFKKLKFNVQAEINLTAFELMRTARKVAYEVDHTNYGCLVFCILSHGAEGRVYGTDGRPVVIRSITEHFNGINCDTLRGKPKVFFILACQGDVSQKGVERDTHTQVPEPKNLIPNESDFLIGYSAPPGYVSYLHGSWYITQLVEKLEKYNNKEDLQSILTMVNMEVSKRNAKLKSEGKAVVPPGLIGKQSAMHVSLLRKKVFWET